MFKVSYCSRIPVARHGKQFDLKLRKMIIQLGKQSASIATFISSTVGAFKSIRS